MAYFRKRGNKWSFTVDIGRDPVTNKRKQKTMSGFESEAKARIACEEFLRRLEEGKETERVNLQEFIRSYFEKEVKKKVSNNTYQNQLNWAERYIIPMLGKKRIDRISYSDIMNFYADMEENGVGRGTIKNVAMVLKKTFKAASIRELIDRNPAQYASPPPYKPPKMKIWTVEEMKLFLERSEGRWLHIFYVIGLTTGMRCGEMLALNWDDIDLSRGRIQIDKSLSYNSEYGLTVGPPKNDNAYRTITIPRYTVDKLRTYRENQLTRSIVIDNGGNYVYPSEAWRAFQIECKRCGVRPIRLHDMRHTHATHLLQKYPVSVVAERLGDTETTIWNTYSHMLPGMQDEVAAHLDDVF